MTTGQLTFKRVEKHADLLTPVGIFKRLSGEKKFLLESSFQHERKGKFSYIGANPYMEIIGRGAKTTTIDLRTGEKTEHNLHALDYIKEHLPKIDVDIPLSFIGGAIGYVAYDTIRSFVDIGPEPPDELDMPDVHFMLYDTIIAYDHRTDKAHIITINVGGVSDAALDEKIDGISKELHQVMDIPEPQNGGLLFQPQIDEATFIEKVKKAQQYIRDGEAEQIVLSQRMVSELTCDPFSYYRHLRSKNPSPYMFYIDFDDYLILGSSPESLVQTNGAEVVTNPIAGTRPRGKTAEEDERLEKELLSDPKELSEHDMLVDLSKVDLGKVCDKTSIHVPVHKDVVKYEHVMHIVSEVHGKLKEGFSSIDALIACLPAGTVSGSPKTRAMQIINELETVKRGVYAGGIGFISYTHDINLAIAIRSLVIKDKKAYLQAGAGIVLDSVPEKEFQETLHKARSLSNI